MPIDVKYYKWLAIIPGWILGDYIGAIAAYLLLQEFVAKRSENLDFELSLLTICTQLIASDGKVDKVEIDTVRDYFKRTYGVARTNKIFIKFKTSKFKNFTQSQLCDILKSRANPNDYYSILQFLFYVASSDGKISVGEDKLIHTIGFNLGFTKSRILAIKSQFVKSSFKSKKYDYKTLHHLSILGLDENANMSEVKKSYRKLVKEFHPDKLSGVSEPLKELAKEKFLTVQESYEFLIKII